MLRHLITLEYARLVTTHDKARGQLSCLYEVLCELAFDHLMLHLLQDRILSSLEVLDQDLLTLLGTLQPLQLLD